jgi:predicted nucleotidyltransferase
MGGLDVIDERFTAIYERAVAVLEPDERVTSVSIGGSVGAGTADRWSDLDLEIVVGAEHYDDFLADWAQWLEAITPTVFARTPILPFIINAVTVEGLTLDLVVYKDAVFYFDPPSTYAVGMLSGTRFDDVGDALEYAVVEQLRGMAGPFISLVQRDEHLRHLTGVPHLLGLLTTVFLAELDAPPPGKHWNQTYSDEQLAAVAALPAVRATRDSIIGFGLALAELLVTRARPQFEQREIAWPAPLAAATAERLRSSLGIETSDWLF